ncbi:co-chaperone HscB [Colwellia psychrerythraea]|uniref:Co-chaperone protein HscB homolog n=1 Tax=Colwellia psychrerythraea TaxID=28229 RepID=A0A099KQ51_COLPS|nr:co-chaperone HscB [Colwellia psychrerythraea]KGJ91773.1 Co-chaperone protein hscB [Colwellia psychrerythraea]
MNYFQLFNIETSFDVDLQQLSSNYQTLQKAVHPDKFAHASEQEQRIAVQKSAHINDAYQTLKSPLQRAQYILVLRGVEMPNEQHSFQDISFLMRQMELREMLEEIRHSSDVDAALLEVQSVLSTEYLQLSKMMRAQISENNAASNSAACDNLRKLKFYQKLNVEVDRLEDSLFED